jgi:DNA-binding transcriptional MerR regulator
MSSPEQTRHETYTIAEVAERTGLSAHTLRYYERAGLIDPVGRSTAGRRTYGAADLERIAFLMRLRHTGMSIADMTRFAEYLRQGPASIPDRLKVLREHRERLHERIEDLQENGRALDHKIAFYEDRLAEQ